MSARTRLFSLSGLIWVIGFLSAIIPAWRVELVARSGQPAAHWRQGLWIIEHQDPTANAPLSHTVTDSQAVNPTWLSDVVLAAVGQATGWNGLIILTAAVFATILWRLYRLLIDEGADCLLAVLLTGLGAAILAARLEAVPALASHLITVMFVAKLRAFERERISVGRLSLWLISLTALGANLDPGFLTGLGILGLVLISHAGNRQKRTPLAVISICALAATLANPIGWRLPAWLLTFATDPSWSRYAIEWHSPNFHLPTARGLLLLVATVTLLLTVARPRLRASEIWWLAAGGWLALRADRHVPALAIVALPILAAHWSAWLSQRREEEGRTAWHATADWLRDLQTTGRTVMVMAALVLLAFWALLRSAAPFTPEFPERFPVAAARFVEQHPGRVQGRLVHAFEWGSYLAWRLPSEPVFLDHRPYRYPPDVVEDFATLDRIKPDWQEVANRRQIGWTLLPVAHGLNTLLGLAPGWEEVYRDELAVIHTRTVTTD